MLFEKKDSAIDGKIYGVGGEKYFVGPEKNLVFLLETRVSCKFCRVELKLFFFFWLEKCSRKINFFGGAP